MVDSMWRAARGIAYRVAYTVDVWLEVRAFRQLSWRYPRERAGDTLFSSCSRRLLFGPAGLRRMLCLSSGRFTLCRR